MTGLFLSWPLKQTYISPRTKCWRITPQGRKVSFKTQNSNYFLKPWTLEVYISWTNSIVFLRHFLLQDLGIYITIYIYICVALQNTSWHSWPMYLDEKQYFSKLDFPELRKDQREFPKQTVFFFLRHRPYSVPLNVPQVLRPSPRYLLGQALENMLVKMGLFRQISGWTFQKLFELPPPSKEWICWHGLPFFP